MNGVRFEKVSWEEFQKDFPGATKEMWDNIQLPKRSSKGSACYDFFCPYDVVLNKGVKTTIYTGIKVTMPSNIVLKIQPRSGYGSKYQMRLCNTIGVIDSDYYNNEKTEGHIMAVCTVDDEINSSLYIHSGDKFIQGGFTFVIFTEDDDAGGERVGGFGSTGA